VTAALAINTASNPARAPASATGHGAFDSAGSDEQLARRAGAGDRDAFDSLVRRFADRVLSFVRTRVRDPHDAEEATQETFLRAWSSISRFDPSRRFSTWLFTIAHRQSLDVLRRRRPSGPRLARGEDEATSGHPERPTSGRESVWELARSLLPDGAYELLYLSYAEGKSPADLARITGRTSVAVRVTLHRARERLRRELEASENSEGES
jgi:RNA polymerase sigma-70 factor (ECF subfamily)